MDDRAFWAIFAAAWLAYFGLYVSVGAVEQGGFAASLRLAGMNTGPPALVSVVLALRRRDLLRPERTLTQTLLVHVAAGALFALSTTAIITATVALMGWKDPNMGEAGPVAAFLFRSIGAVFLYLILAGFLMWTESLRRVHESRSLAAREAMLRAQAEAKALRAQFNPHFVFNTLHSLMLLVRADPPAAERAIEDVATLIRYASILQRQEIDIVPLTKELAVARRYVGLEKLRLEHRLTVAFEVEVAPEEVSIPAFALQTLLENAVKHGVEPSEEGGNVRVEIRREGDALALTVADDGVGADPDRVAAATGHGLDLLTRRLGALYDGAASLSWRTAPREGFEARMTVPWSAPPPAPEMDAIREETT